MNNTLYFGDNLDILRAQLADASVGLVYLDPPFNRKRDYNLLFKTPFVARRHKFQTRPGGKTGRRAKRVVVISFRFAPSRIKSQLIHFSPKEIRSE